MPCLLKRKSEELRNGERRYFPYSPIWKLIPAPPADNTAFLVTVDGQNPSFPIAQNDPKQTEIDFGTHTVVETEAAGYDAIGWKVFQPMAS